MNTEELNYLKTMGICIQPEWNTDKYVLLQHENLYKILHTSTELLINGKIPIIVITDKSYQIKTSRKQTLTRIRINQKYLKFIHQLGILILIEHHAGKLDAYADLIKQYKEYYDSTWNDER